MVRALVQSSPLRLMVLAPLLVAAGAGPAAAAAKCPPGIITTAAGTGDQGWSGDGGSPLNARLGGAYALAIGPDGSLYFPEKYNNRVRKIEHPGEPDAVIITVAGNGRQGFSGDGGPATKAMLNWPQGVAVGPDGTLYIADTNNERVRMVDRRGIIMTIAGNGRLSHVVPQGGPATAAAICHPNRLAVGADGTLFLTDMLNRVHMVDPLGMIFTLCGITRSGYWGDDGEAVMAGLRDPQGLALGTDGSIYIADKQNHRIRRIDPQGFISTVAGCGIKGYWGDGGPATHARLDSPHGVAVGPDGSIYIADCGNSRIRKVNPDGIISTIAGTGKCGHSGDGGPATQAPICRPYDVVIGPDGSLYISEAYHWYIRRVCPAPATPPEEGAAD